MTHNPPPVLDDSEYMAMASRYTVEPHSPHQQPPQNDLGHMQLHQNPSYSEVGSVNHHGVQQNVRPPPLPPKPPPRRRVNGHQRPTMGVQFARQLPLGGHVSNHTLRDPYLQQTANTVLPHPVVPRPLPDVTPALKLDIRQLNARVFDAESKVKEKDFELSQCNAELSKARRCLDEKKEDLKERNLEFHRLRSEYDRLKQTSGRAQPQVAHTEVALQSQVQHYKKISDELRIQLEQLRRQPQPPPPPPVNTVDTQEIYRLRDEVRRYHVERQRMTEDIRTLTSANEVLSAQVKTYEEDFKSEREDRQRAAAKMERMQGEIDNLNHIVTILGGQQQQQENLNWPP